MKLAQLLEMAKFKQFWLESGEVEVLEKATGWQEAIRDFIGGVVSCTYRSISAGSSWKWPSSSSSGLNRGRLRCWRKRRVGRKPSGISSVASSLVPIAPSARVALRSFST